jgi:nicotinamide-nucleotide amidase
MRGLLVEEVLPRVAQRVGSRRVVLSRTLRTTGVPESALAERIGPVEDDIAPLTLAYIPSIDGVDLRLTAWSLPPDEAERRLAEAAAGLRARLEEHYYGEDGVDLAAVVLEALRARSGRLAVGESCTGGLLAGRLTAIPGASDVFVGAVVAYDDSVKTDLLGVPPTTLDDFGAVSVETALAMAIGAQERFGVEATLAVTGIAGPSGGTPEKPVGTVCLAVRLGSEGGAVQRVFPGDRHEIRARSAQAALNLLRRTLADR